MLSLHLKVSDSIESTLAQTGKSTETVTDMNERATRSIPDSKEVQKEWTCAICQVTTQSEITLNSHHRGNRHKANYEELKANNLRAKNKGFPASTAKKVVQISQSPPFWCDICDAKCPRKFNYYAHLKGKRHLARIRQLAGLVGGQHD
uniref:C2H2-type domain-containing protein n=1 Tax=Fagus sylvatica TaxID=28930 RepID=A0A2N9IU18_FAGSY